MDFSTANPIELSEVLKFATNAIDAVQIGIQTDNSKAVANGLPKNDPIIEDLVNNGIAQQATIEIDPCKSGKDKYFIQTPYVMSDVPLGTDDDGQGCCVGTPTVTACRYRLGIDELCVKDCVATSLDEMLEQAVKQKAIDTSMPWGKAGASIAAKRAAFVAMYAKETFQRNFVLGTPTTRGDGMRPFNGVVSRLLDERTLKVDGSAGFLSSIETLACRMLAQNMTLDNYRAYVNPIALPTLLQEVRAYLKSDPLTEWRINGNTVSYRGLVIRPSKYVDVDLTTNTTSMWVIAPSKVGIKALYPITRPYLKRHESEEDCGGHCLTMHNAGTTVVTNWNGLMMINNIHLSSICDSYALSGLDQFVNGGVIGQLYPKVTTNPSL